MDEAGPDPRSRRKRKRRAAPGEADWGNGGAPPRAEGMRRGYAKAEEHNREARESLEPLDRGARPTVVTLGAIFAAVVALIFWVSCGVAVLTEETVNGRRPSPLPLALFALIMTAMSIGMWRARYWAVLGFQMLLVLFLLAAVAGIVNAGTWLQLIGTLLLIGICGALFFFMVKAMARIQMPERPGQR